MTTTDPLYNDWIHQQLRAQPDSLAVHDLTDNRAFTWRQLNDRVDALARRLCDEGIKMGDRIAYLGLNSSDVVEIFFATVRIGAVYVPLNFRLTPPELSFIIGDCTPSAVFYDQSFQSVVDDIDSAVMPNLMVTSALDGTDSAYEDFVTVSSTALAPAAANADTLSMIMYSSGTTTSLSAPLSRLSVRAGE